MGRQNAWSRWAPGALALVLAGCGQEQYVLVHGSWMGSWAWESVARGLTYDGAKVTSVNLPAHSTDPASPRDVTLGSYVQRVAAAVEAASGPVHLVGHSMAGMVISQYAEGAAARVKDLIYVAAYLPADGESLSDLANQDPGSLVGPALQVNSQAGTAALPQSQLGDIFCGDCSPSELATLQNNYRDEPLAPISTPVHLSDVGFGVVSKKYVFTLDDRTISHALQEQMAGKVALSGSVTLSTSHTPLLSDPASVVGALKELTR
ncbi:MAG TPA: alpha/beta fold hydrolase [Myxococcales bacterium]|nr:alpha/beta fold hydrolase [Myxococcales bacterium]